MMLPDQTFTYDSPVILVGAAPVPLDGLFAELPDALPIIAADGGAPSIPLRIFRLSSQIRQSPRHGCKW